MDKGVRVTREQVLAFRMVGHNLQKRRPVEDIGAVAGACGVRNTPPGTAIQALAARIDALPSDAVDRGLHERTLVEVLAMRASPHVVPAADIGVFTSGSLPHGDDSIRASLSSIVTAIQREMTLTEAVQRVTAAAREELTAGPLERGALSEGITKRVPGVLSPYCVPCRSVHVNEMLFRLAGVHGAYVIADRSGKKDLYAETQSWLGESTPIDQDDARIELLRRYLRCFGPSTSGHFAAWVGIGAADACRTWEGMSHYLSPVEFQGRIAWVHKEDAELLASPPEPIGVRMLPPYDSYLDARDRSTLVPDEPRHKQVWKALGNPGTVLMDGEIVGIWRPQKKGKRLTIAVEGFTPLTPAQRTDIEEQATALGPLRGAATVEVMFRA